MSIKRAFALFLFFMILNTLMPL